MTRRLCVGKPPEWWEPANDGARLALTLCRACPNLTRCPGGDPNPHGVIRAGAAYNDAGTAVPVCPCGRPVTDFRGGTIPPCPRCRVPDVPIPDPTALRRRRVEICARAGMPDGMIAVRLGVSAKTVRNDRIAAGIRRTAGHTATLQPRTRASAGSEQVAA
jgi:hypothetical protein